MSELLELSVKFMNTIIKSKLQELGFSKNETLVYSALLEIGRTSAGKIITETKLHRSVVYETLARLIDKKLVFKMKENKISYFQATDPARILDNINSQQQTAQELIPKLTKIIGTKLPEINVYRGLSSYRRFWLNSYYKLPAGTIDYISNSVGKRWMELMGEDIEAIMNTRIKRKIKWQMIVMEKDQVETELVKKYPALHEYRLVKKEIHRFGNFNIFGDESVILQSTTEPMIIEIKNETLVKVFRNIFDILWESGQEIK